MKGVGIVFGVKLDGDSIDIQEGNADELEEKGYKVFDTRDDARIYGLNHRFFVLSKERNALDKNSPRAKEIEKIIYKPLIDHGYRPPVE